ncbi:hypothetical protein PVK06_027153 [Gossypium arboreum]|uniref:Uncharacterized protein n=1 Tax=Gossypium arboreum TaxID=29729 RepID=A0ABR0P322_GOSAR|nr:hypothetical protein PVK06_027153 [Gossypium arboreum]
MGKRGASDKVIARVPAEIKRVASTPRFKWRKVSAVRDFSLGCGRVAAPNFGLGSGDHDFLVLYMIRIARVTRDDCGSSIDLLRPHWSHETTVD